MNNKVRNTILKVTSPTRVITGLAITAMAAVHASAAGDGLSGLIDKATDGTDGVSGAAMTIGGISLTIGLIHWGVGKLKPRG